MGRSKALSKAGLEEFGRRVRTHMANAGIRSGGDLATRMSKVAGWRIYRQLTHKWTTGISYPTNENLAALAKTLMVPLSDLVIHETASGISGPAPLSDRRVHFRYTPDPNNPALVRAEMSDVLTIEQAEKIKAVLAAKPPRVD